MTNNIEEGGGALVPAGANIEVTVEDGERSRAQQIALSILEKIGRGEIVVPETIRGEVMPHISAARGIIERITGQSGQGIIESLSTMAKDSVTAVAENAAPVAKKAVGAAQLAHIGSIVARYGIIKGAGKAMSATVKDGITVWLARVVIDRLQEMVENTAENIQGATA